MAVILMKRKEKDMEQLLQLEEWLFKAKKVAIAFSGGIDSTLLAVMAKQTLGAQNVLLVIGDSSLHKPEDAQEAERIANHYQIPYQKVFLDELSLEAIRNNHPDSWFHSKCLLYNSLKQEALDRGIQVIADGMILDDLKDYRPGLIARDKYGVVSPLITCGFDKASVRQAAKTIGIETWNKIPSCSLLSRFPYHSEISLAAIDQVKAIEGYLTDLGFTNCRARHYQSMVKLEINADHMDYFWERKTEIIQWIKELGVSKVSLDLDGYQYGTMNKDLVKNKGKVTACSTTI